MNLSEIKSIRRLEGEIIIGRVIKVEGRHLHRVESSRHTTRLLRTKS